MQKFVLASKSPRRRELFSLMGIENFRVIDTDCDESIPNGTPPAFASEKISLRKCLAALPLCFDDEIVVAADTIVYLDGKILTKPADENDAFLMLSQLSGCEHEVFTGVTVSRGGEVITGSERTLVRFSPLTEAQILRYIATGEPMDKAGAYGIQGRGAVFIEGITGCYFNVMGLPIHRMSKLLGELSIYLI